MEESEPVFKSTISPEEMDFLARKTMKDLEDLNITFGDAVVLMMSIVMSIAHYQDTSTEDFKKAMLEVTTAYENARKDYGKE